MPTALIAEDETLRVETGIDRIPDFVADCGVLFDQVDQRNRRRPRRRMNRENGLRRHGATPFA